MGLTDKGRQRLEAVASYVTEHGVSENEAAKALGIPDASWYNLKKSRGALGATAPDIGVKTRRRRPLKMKTIEVAPLPGTPPHLQSRVFAFVGEARQIAEMFHL